MWNYSYDNGYDIYANCGYSLIGTHPNQNSLYYMNEGTANGLEHISNPLIVSDIPETINYVGDVLSDDTNNKNTYKDFNDCGNQYDYCDSSTEPSTKEDSYGEPESSGNLKETDNLKKYDAHPELSNNFKFPGLHENSSKNGSSNFNDKELVDRKRSEGDYNQLSPNTTCSTNDLNNEENLSHDSPSNTYDYCTYSGLSYDPWNMSNMENTHLNQMNTTYFWDPNSMNKLYYNGYNGMSQVGYDDVAFNSNNSSTEPYNMTHDPYTLNFMKTVPNTIDMSNTFNIPQGNIFSPNEAFVSPSIKYQQNPYNFFSPFEQTNFFMNENSESQYNYFNKSKQSKQGYVKALLNGTRVNNHTGNRMDLISNNVKNENQFNLKSIDEDTLEGFIYNGNIKKIDLSSIDFINMSDRIWQALRGAGLFKLGNKGRAILKSKISKHLKMYPELRMRTAHISGVRRATTRQLFQLAQICQITSHLR